jgi:nucleoside-diphosphate-sugar epimerase
MRVLFIGGTGNISSAVSRLAVERGVDLYLLTRGRQEARIDGAKEIRGDINAAPADAAKALAGLTFDSVVNWIAFTPDQIDRDVKLFAGKTGQYIFISSASAYQKPPSHPIITESTPLCNPHWDYSRNKIACEEALMRAYRDGGFPATIVRPSLTYDTVIPVSIGSWTDFTIVERMRRGEKIVVHGDGTNLWTVTHSEDFAKGFVGLLAHQQAVGQSFHITSDEVLNWDQIYQAVAEAAGTEARIVHMATDFIVSVEPGLEGTLLGDKAHSAIFDNSKIKRFVPDFQATIPFRRGIRRTIEWFDAKPQRKTIVKENDQMIDRLLKAYGKVCGTAVPGCAV